MCQFVIGNAQIKFKWVGAEVHTSFDASRPLIGQNSRLPIEKWEKKGGRQH